MADALSLLWPGSLFGVLEMVPERFADNQSINDCIYECLQYFEEADRAEIENKLREDARAEDTGTFLHTFRELIFGSYLARRGCRIRPYIKYGEDEPDWSAYDEHENLIALMDVVSFHPLKEVESEIGKELAQGKPARINLDSRYLDKLSKKFFDRLQEKCTCYRELVQSEEVPCLVACFFTFDNWLDEETERIITENLHSASSGFFRDKTGVQCYPDVSGLVTFYEPNLQFLPPDSVATLYAFDYHRNPQAVRPCAFPAGEYYPPMAIRESELYKICVRRGRKEIELQEFLRMLQELKARQRAALDLENP
jgi:hypothetical protein